MHSRTYERLFRKHDQIYRWVIEEMTRRYSLIDLMACGVIDGPRL